jgi:hypothetical protein
MKRLLKNKAGTWKCERGYGGYEDEKKIKKRSSR